MYVGSVRHEDPRTHRRRRYKVSARTWKACNEKLKKLIKDLDAGVDTSGGHTVQDAVDAWAATLGDLAPNTVIQYTNSAQQVANILGPDTRLDRIYADDVEMALRKFALDHTPRTVAHAANQFKKVIAKAKRAGKLSPVIAADIATLDTAVGQADGNPTDALNLEQTHALVAAAQRDGTYIGPYTIISLCDMAPRPEARALIWADVVDGVFRVMHSTRRPKRDGTTLKSERSGRLTLVSAAALRTHKARQATAGIPVGDADPVFTDAAGHKLTAGADAIDKEFPIN